MIPAHEIIRRPVVTERAVAARAKGEYSFEVAKKATKNEIRRAVEESFKVQVQRVRTSRVPEKRRRYGRFVGMRASWKKAIVILKEGQKIEILEAT